MDGGREEEGGREGRRMREEEDRGKQIKCSVRVKKIRPILCPCDWLREY